MKLLDAIGDLPLGNFEDNSIDLFGDAYEYLMQMYASQAGKSGGEYHTPKRFPRSSAKITVMRKSRVNKVYDPAAGSGSLLLKFAKVLGKDNVGEFVGQEINLTTYNLARINMFLHDVNYEKFDIAHGDTLIDPQHWDQNHLRQSSRTRRTPSSGGRCEPAAHQRRTLRASRCPRAEVQGRPGVHDAHPVVASRQRNRGHRRVPGVLYRGGAERKIRKYLIDNNYVDAVIQLPADLFFGTTIATCIIVLKKSKTDSSVLFIDASAEFKRMGNKNKLTAENQRTSSTPL